MIFCQTGLTHCNQPSEVDQVNYVAWLDTPVLMLNCERVLWAPFERSQVPMYGLLPLTHLMVSLFGFSFLAAYMLTEQLG